MNNEKHLEPIIVGAIFEPPSRVRPAWFHWNGRKIKITRTNHTWSERVGIATIHHFSVTDGTDTFHLVMNNSSQSWHIEEVHLET